MSRACETYTFTLVLSGAGALTEELQDALFEAGCDDALLGCRGGVLYLDFDREAASMSDAVLSAIRDVERAGVGVGLEVRRVEFGELVTASEIARRTGRSRESIRLYVEGLRGPGGFPAPVERIKGRSPLYRWSDIVAWMAHAPIEAPAQAPTDTEALELINATLAVRRLAPSVPKAQRVFRSLRMPKLGDVKKASWAAKGRRLRKKTPQPTKIK